MLGIKVAAVTRGHDMPFFEVGKSVFNRGKANGIAHYDDVPAISSQALLHFKKFHAVVHHVEAGFHKVKLGPL